MICDEAEALAIALRYGFADVADAIGWADAVISIEQHPHSTLCDVALAVGKPMPEVVQLLRQIPGIPDQGFVSDLLVQLIHKRIDFAPSNADAIAKGLYYLAISFLFIDQELQQVAWIAWDSLHLADLNIIGNRADVMNGLQTALATAAQRAKSRGHLWQFMTLE